MISSHDRIEGKKKLPRIAIIGRPNVGKSTLFNRILRSRRAITDPTPGVTRDSVEARCLIGDRPFTLIDTGGFSRDEEVFNDLIAEKAISMARAADLVLLLVDVNVLDANDYTFIEEIRPLAEKLFLLVNKVDTPEKENLIYDFYQLGFERLIHLSAAHGRNLGELEEAILEFFKDVEIDEVEDEEQPLRVAILGKPNTGKSTLTNALVGEEKSIVSDIPGTTRDVVEAQFRHKGTLFQILDTAGIRRKKKVTDNVEYYSVNRAISSIETCDVVFLMVESLEGISEQDKKIAALAVNRGRGIIIVLSKWDKMEKESQTLEKAVEGVRYFFPLLGFAPIVPLSSITGVGIRKLLKETVSIREQLDKRIDTPRLNNALKRWVDYYPLRSKGKPIRLLYMTQVSANPVKFVLFVSRKQGYRDEYTKYLKNQLKDEFGFDKVPFTLDIRQR